MTTVQRSGTARLRAAAGVLLVGGGVLTMVVGGGALLWRDEAERAWTASDEFAQAARQVDAPTPRWIDQAVPPPTPRPQTPTTRPSATVVTVSRVAQPPLAPATAGPVAAPESRDATADASGPELAASDSDALPAAAPPNPAEDDGPVIVGVARAPAGAVEIVESAFRFLDPPEPGAQARVAVTLRNHSDVPTGPLRLTLSTRWLAAWRVVAADPPVIEDRVRESTRRSFDFPGLDAHAEGSFELRLTATDDAVDPPELRLALAVDLPDDRPEERQAPSAADGEIGVAQPETVSPRPRPGPARAIEIPRLGLRAAVVQTTWEPPSFVVGQIKQSANLSEGNSVLIGHLNGLGGNVFARLDALEPGDEIIATSRGLEYRFIVSEMLTLPGDDSIPMQPTDEPRLTLMTCIGEWDPIGLDYSHRLWVVAEPAELAETTLTGETPGPLTRLLGLVPPITLVPPDDPGRSGKVSTAATDTAADDASGAPHEPAVAIEQPEDGALVGSAVIVNGRLRDGADSDAPLWLAIRAEIEGSRWYVQPVSLDASRDRSWQASLEIGGAAGIRHTIVVAPVDAATDRQLRQHVARQEGEPVPILPDAFEDGARVVVERT